MEDQSKIFWHGAFFEALQLEFNDYLDDLEFKEEQALSKEALIMDVLIVKKKTGRKIDKNIGRIFKGHNIIEFKSETDTLTWMDYNKVLAYGLLYSAFHKVWMDDITLSFCVTAYPRALFKRLEEKRGLVIKSVEPGIYNIVGDVFTIQVLESKHLTAEENLFVRNLRSNLTLDEVAAVAGAYRNLDIPSRKRTYFNTLLQANFKTLREVDGMYETIDELYEIALESPFWSKMLRRDSKKMAEVMAPEMAREMALGIASEMASEIVAEKEAAMSLEAQERNRRLVKRLLAKGFSHTAVAEDMELTVDDVLALA